MKKPIILVSICLLTTMSGLLVGAEAFPSEYQLRDELVEAVRYGNMRDFNRLFDEIKRQGSDINSTITGFGYNPLMMAADTNNVEVIKRLLTIPTINVNKIAGVDGLTALMIAVKKGNVEAVKELLKAPATDVNVISTAGDGPALMIAAKNGFPETVQLLLNAGANPLQDAWDIPGMHGKTALDVAATEEIKKTLQDWIEQQKQAIEESELVQQVPPEIRDLLVEFTTGIQPPKHKHKKAEPEQKELTEEEQWLLSDVESFAEWKKQQQDKQ